MKWVQTDLFNSNGDDDGGNRADQIYARFKLFHAENPEVWTLFKRFAFEVIRRGREHYSVNAIFERIRWHVDIETESSDELKLNNDFRAYYARMFHAKHDIMLFELRRLRSNNSPGYDQDEESWVDGPPDPVRETRLRAELRQL